MAQRLKEFDALAEGPRSVLSIPTHLNSSQSPANSGALFWPPRALQAHIHTCTHTRTHNKNFKTPPTSKPCLYKIWCAGRIFPPNRKMGQLQAQLLTFGAASECWRILDLVGQWSSMFMPAFNHCPPVTSGENSWLPWSGLLLPSSLSYSSSHAPLTSTRPS